MSAPESNPRSPAIDYLSAGFSAALLSMFFTPLEQLNIIAEEKARELRVTRKQVFSNLLQPGSDVFKSAIPATSRYAMIQGLDFTLKEVFNSRLKHFETGLPLTFASHFLTGATAGLSSFTVLYPVDVITHQYTLDKQTRDLVKLNSKDAIRAIWQHVGLKGFYYKYAWNAPAVILNKGLYFGVYDTIKMHLIGQEFQSSFSLNLVAGCAAAFTATIIPHPLALVSNNTNKENLSYGTLLKEELRSFISWRIPNLGVRTLRGGLLLAMFDKLTTSVYNRNIKRNRPS